jgi:hypothetical protein
MKWTHLLSLSLIGACMGGMALFGITQQIELALWMIIALATAFFIARTTSHKIFLHGVLAGIGMGVFSAAVQSVFFNLYTEYNQIGAAEIQSFSLGFPPPVFILLTSPVIGGLYGLVIGALSLAASKFHHPK